MKISDYSVGMSSSNMLCRTLRVTHFSSLTGTSETCLMEEDKSGSTFGDAFSDTMSNLRDLYSKESSGVSRNLDVQEMYRDSLNKLRARLMSYFLKWLFGEDYETALASASGQSTLVTHEYATNYSESESTSFSASGKVITADGREIEFDASFTMTRSFECAYNKKFVQFEFMDPLVVNLNDCPAELGSFDFIFDLDCDGMEETLSGLSSKSGFLALDLDENGSIDNGSELFGAKSGNGFADLARYDEDNNGWIDENDSVFDKLKVWQVMADGSQRLLDLKELGIGALYLESTRTDFHMTDTIADEASAYIKKTGLFLYENGMSGTLQQVDLAKLA